MLEHYGNHKRGIYDQQAQTRFERSASYKQAISLSKFNMLSLSDPESPWVVACKSVKASNITKLHALRFVVVRRFISPLESSRMDIYSCPMRPGCILRDVRAALQK